MSSTVQLTNKNSKKYTKKQWSQYATVLTASLALLASGFHFGWPSPSVPKLLSDEYPFDVTSEEASYIVITGSAGDIIGGPLAGLLVDVIGRKTTILLIALPQIASFLMIHFSDSALSLLYTARFIGGMAEGACFSVLPIYIGEVSEPKLRGELCSYISVILILGIFLSNVIGSFLSLSTAALVYTGIPVCFLLSFWYFPESPYYYLMKNEVNKARDALRFLRLRTDVEDELNSITADVKRQLSEPGTFRELVSVRSNRRACIVMIGMRFAQQFSGIAAFMLYAQVLFAEAGTDVSPTVASIIFGGTQLVVAYVTSFHVDRVGRKPLMIVSCAGCCLTLIVLSGYFFVRDYTSVRVGDGFGWLPLIGMLCFVVVFAVGLGTVVNLMLGELFSASIKAKALYIMNIHFAASLAVSTKFFQYTSDRYGLGVPMFVFAVCSLFGAIFCHVYMPETKGKTLEDIQQFLKGN